jgi:hypothetical protein
MPLTDTTRYELPSEGTTLLGYIARRMHKTELLVPVAGLLEMGESEQAFSKILLYTAAASTSYGRAYYQPEFNRVGDQVSTADPATGWMVSAKLDARSPHYAISYRAASADGATFSGSEEITGTTVGLRGLGMPAPSRFEFVSAASDYWARMTGIITSELALSLFAQTSIRAYGFLTAEDSRGNTARVELTRNGEVSLKLNAKRAEQHSLLRLVWQEQRLPVQK